MEETTKKQSQKTENNFEAVFDYLNRIEEEIKDIRSELDKKSDEKTNFTLERKVERLERELGEIKNIAKNRRRSPARR